MQRPNPNPNPNPNPSPSPNPNKGRYLAESLEGELLAEVGRDRVELELDLAQRSDHLQAEIRGDIGRYRGDIGEIRADVGVTVT